MLVFIENDSQLALHPHTALANVKQLSIDLNELTPNSYSHIYLDVGTYDHTVTLKKGKQFAEHFFNERHTKKGGYFLDVISYEFEQDKAIYNFHIESGYLTEVEFFIYTKKEDNNYTTSHYNRIRYK